MAYDAETYHQQARTNMIRNRDSSNPSTETVELVEQLISLGFNSPKLASF